MFILEDVQCNPAGLNKSANKEYVIKRCYDVTLKTVGRNLTTEVLANAQLVSSKLADMYLCSDGLPIEKSSLFKGYQTIKSEWQNRDNRMRYTLMRPGDSFWDASEAKSRIDWSGSADELSRARYTSFVPNWGSGYFPQKWATERYLGTDDKNASYDWPVLRYAEVLLTYAEAVYERDDKISDEDLNKSLNLVRQRVNKKIWRLPTLSLPPTVWICDRKYVASAPSSFFRKVSVSMTSVAGRPPKKKCPATSPVSVIPVNGRHAGRIPV